MIKNTKNKLLDLTKFLVDIALNWNFTIYIIEFISNDRFRFQFHFIRVLCGYAYRLSHKGDFDRSRFIADRILLLTNDSQILNFLSPIYKLQGDLEKSTEVLTKAYQSRREFAKLYELDKLNLRVFFKSFTPVGHTGLIDIFLKAQILGIIESKKNIILGDLSCFANPCLVKYWENYCSLINNRETVTSLSQITHSIEEHLGSFECLDGRILGLEEFAMETQMQWESKGKSNLLNITSEHKKCGYHVLQSLGIPEGAWFCGLHVREGNDDLRSIRNARIETYQLAIEEVTKRGGWVIRMGDKSMKPYKASGLNYIDYVFSKHQSDWMDVFIWSEGRFFIGTGSGPSAIPICFGKPVAFSNWGPLGHRQWGKIDLLLPKLYVHKKTQIPLTMVERLSSNCAYHESHKALKSMGVDVIDNSPEEIRELVVEMLLKIDLKQNPTLFQIKKKERFASHSIQYKVYPSDLANAFIDRYQNF